MSFQREEGILKRTDGTPLPAASFLGARILHAVFVAVLLVVITAAFGRGLYHATIPGGLTLLRFILMVLVGSAAFCALGLAATSVIPNADASAAIVNAIILPLEFLSGIFIAFGDTTPGVDLVGGSGVPDPALRARHAGRLPRHCRSAGRTCSSWPRGGWAACSSPSGSSAGCPGRPRAFSPGTGGLSALGRGQRDARELESSKRCRARRAALAEADEGNRDERHSQGRDDHARGRRPQERVLQGHGHQPAGAPGERVPRARR